MRERLRVRGYRHGDLDKVAAREDFAEERAVIRGMHADLEGMFSYTVIRPDGEIAACGGVRLLADQPGAAALWGYATDLRRREWAEVARHVRAVLDTIAGARFFKAYAWARITNEAARAFLAHLGFRPVGVVTDQESGIAFVTMSRRLDF